MCTLREAVNSDDPPWDGAGAAIWSIIELNCAIICASLPTLRPLLAKVVPGMSSNHNNYNSNYASYERYGSQYLHGSNPRLGAHVSVKTSRRGPRSISTEELALNDMDSSIQGGMPSVYVESIGGHPEHDHPEQIMVTKETLVSTQRKQ